MDFSDNKHMFAQVVRGACTNACVSVCERERERATRQLSRNSNTPSMCMYVCLCVFLTFHLCVYMCVRERVCVCVYVCVFERDALQYISRAFTCEMVLINRHARKCLWVRVSQTSIRGRGKTVFKVIAKWADLVSFFLYLALSFLTSMHLVVSMVLIFLLL